MNDEKALRLGKKLLPAMAILREAAEEAGVRLLITSSEDGSAMALFTDTGYSIDNFHSPEKYQMIKSEGSLSSYLTRDLEGEKIDE